MSHPSNVSLTYTGSTPGADTNTYPLFNSVTAFPGQNYAQSAGYKRLYCSVSHSHDGAFVFSKSHDRGLTWQQVTPNDAVTAVSSTDAVFDGLIEGFPDFKLEWVNASTAQNPWKVSLALTDERGVAT